MQTPQGQPPQAQTLTLTRPDDWHLHLRDGAALRAVVAASAAQFGRAVVMPNLRPPVTTTALAQAYRDRIQAALRDVWAAQPTGAPSRSTPDFPGFTPLMTLYLTDRTTAAEVRRAKASGVVVACKLYPAGATTNSDAGVTDLRGLDSTLTAMAEVGLPLLLHGEVTDPRVDIFDREAVYLERVLTPLLARQPKLRVVLEHITTAAAVAFVRAGPPCLAATITAHHLLRDRNAMLAGGIRPHLYCLPILKRAEDREALLDAATSAEPRFFLGTDSAPHAAVAKEQACGCAGCYTALAALPLYATAFESAGALDRLEAFASFHGPDFYGLPRNRTTVTLARTPWTVPETVPFGPARRLVPYFAGQELPWRLLARAP